MRVSLNWLSSYIDVSLPPATLAEKLTLAGLEVESYENPGEKYRNFVVGHVVEKQRHPNADTLTVCTVDVGNSLQTIVCGAPNVEVGQKVPVGLEGAVVPRNQHDPHAGPFKLSRAKIRGVESSGMICSPYELELGDDVAGIMVLEPTTAIGLPLARYLGLDDVVFEIGITPNRPDAMSVIGIAREIGAMTGRKVRFPLTKPKESGNHAARQIIIRIDDSTNCPRYSARIIRNVRNGQSPRWMQDRLNRIGIRPINSIVDITNYVLMELGQPLHAFDYDLLKGRTVIVRCAKNGETFETLDHKTRNLREDTLLICDGEKPVALAGVMGGLNSEITDHTVNVLIESAYFNPRNIRRTSKYMGLSSDASQRFERGTDPNITTVAADRAALLIQEHCGGEVMRGIVDVYPRRIREKTVTVRLGRVNEILGTHLQRRTVVSLLRGIGIHEGVARKGDRISLRVPTFRPDVEREIDVIEEIARLYGYDRIETRPESTQQFSTASIRPAVEDTVREYFVGTGYREIVANSMQEKELASLITSNYVTIANPISQEMGSMRTSLVPGMLRIIRNNIFQGNKDLRIFEIGKVYHSGDDPVRPPVVQGFHEELKVIVVLSGQAGRIHWSEKNRSVDIYDLKGEIESFCEKISLDNIHFIPYSTTKALTHSGLRIEILGEEVGFLGKIHEGLLKKFEIEQDVLIAELSIDRIQGRPEVIRKFRPLPKYPPVVRDLAFVVRDDLPVTSLEKTIRESGGPLLQRLDLFDIYRGDQIDGERKSCAFSLTFISAAQTLSQEQVDRIVREIIRHVEMAHNGQLRQ